MVFQEGTNILVMEGSGRMINGNFFKGNFQFVEEKFNQGRTGIFQDFGVGRGTLAKKEPCQGDPPSNHLLTFACVCTFELSLIKYTIFPPRTSRSTVVLVVKKNLLISRV